MFSTSAILDRALSKHIAVRGAATQTILPALDGVRALAAVLVVFTHSRVAAGTWGAAGVALFFVLSGYLLFPPLVKQANSSRNILAYLIRRFFRLVPIYFVAVAVHTAFLWRDAELLYEHLTFRYAIWQFWTVKMEVLFYAALPAIAILSGQLGTTARSGLLLFLAATAYAGTEWAPLFHVQVGPDQDMKFLITPFLLGAWLAVVQSKVSVRAARTAFLVGTAGLVFLCTNHGVIEQLRIAVIGLARFNGTQFHGVLYPAVLCIVLGAARGDLKALAHPALTTIGVAGYSFYLWHNLVISGLSAYGLAGWIVFSLCILLTIPVATASYMLLERPFIAMGRALAQRVQGREA